MKVIHIDFPAHRNAAGVLSAQTTIPPPLDEDAVLAANRKRIPPQLERFDFLPDLIKENEEAKETGTAEDMDRFSRRTVKVTREHNEECRRLLTLMGIPFVVVRIPQAFLNGALTNRSGRTRAGTLRSRSPVCRTRAGRKG